jgi:hypothetical protein
MTFKYQLNYRPDLEVSPLSLVRLSVAGPDNEPLDMIGLPRGLDLTAQWLLVRITPEPGSAGSWEATVPFADIHSIAAAETEAQPLDIDQAGSSNRALLDAFAQSPPAASDILPEPGQRYLVTPPDGRERRVQVTRISERRNHTYVAVEILDPDGGVNMPMPLRFDRTTFTPDPTP